MRKLGAVAAGLTAAILLVGTGVSQGALVNITVDDNQFDPKTADFDFLLAGDQNVVWDWGELGGGTNNNHNVVQKKGLFKSGNPKDDGSFEILASAGKYPYYCEVHRGNGMKGKVNIIPAAGTVTSDSIEVHWARTGTTTGKRFDVRYRVDDEKPKYWKRNTKKFSGVFGGANDKPVAVDLTSHDYEFQVRSKKGNPRQKRWSGFSPPLVVTGP